MILLLKKFLLIYLQGREGEKRETNISARDVNWLPLSHPQMGTWPTTQACALTGNRTSNFSVFRLALSPLSHTSQGKKDPSLNIQNHTVMSLIQSEAYSRTINLLTLFMEPLQLCWKYHAVSQAYQQLMVKTCNRRFIEGKGKGSQVKIKEQILCHLPAPHCWAESWRQWRFRTSCAPLFYSKFFSSSTRVFLYLLLCLSDNT